MAKKVLQSFAMFELRLPAITVGGRKLPELVLPRGKYSEAETARGKRPVVELDEVQVARVEADEIVTRMFSPHGNKGKIGYRWLDHMPAQYKTAGDEVIRLQQENAQLRAAMRKAGVAVPGEGPVAAQGSVTEVPDAQRDDSAGPLSAAIQAPDAAALAQTDVSL